METDSDFKAIAKKMVKGKKATAKAAKPKEPLSLIHISEPTRPY